MKLQGLVLGSELMKLLRTEWRTVEELVLELESASTSGVRRALDELGCAGIVKEREGARRRLRGVPPREFALTRSWGGVA